MAIPPQPRLYRQSAHSDETYHNFQRSLTPLLKGIKDPVLVKRITDIADNVIYGTFGNSEQAARVLVNRVLLERA